MLNYVHLLIKKEEINVAVYYSSSDSNIVNVNEFGIVTAKSIGTAVISGTIDGISESIVVDVKDKQSNPVPTNIKVKSVSLGITNTTEYVGNNLQLSVKVNPSTASGYNIGWSSSNNDIAEVDNNGLVKMKKIGTAVIKVKVYDKEASVTILVKEKVNISKEVSEVLLNKKSLELESGLTSTLTATTLPVDAINKNITWLSSDNKIATVSNGVVTALASGKAMIMATTSNGKSASCTIIVKEKIPQEVIVTGISLNKALSNLEIGETEKLMVTISPQDATNKNVTWSSSDNKIATVSNGVVTAKASGKATITATTNNGKMAMCDVIVKVKVENCTFSLKEGNIKDNAISNIESINNTLQCAHRNGIKTLVVPKGNYYFDVRSTAIVIDFSNITLDLNGSTFNVYNNNLAGYSLIRINNQDAGIVTLKNGILKGDRYEHTCNDGSEMVCQNGGLSCPNDKSSSHEWGHGIVIESSGVNIENLTIAYMTGDGIYISFPNSTAKTESVNIKNNIIDYGRRNGISIIQGKNINILNNTIKNTQGTWPQVGIDIERNNESQFSENILIEKNYIYGNAGRRSVQIFPGIKGYIKVIYNHLGDQIVGWNHSSGAKLEHDLIIVANNDAFIPVNEQRCVEDANQLMSHANRVCNDKLLIEDKCSKKRSTHY